MEFTTPCFIRKNTQELRRGLEELGYEMLNFGNTTLDGYNYDGNGSHKSIEEGRAIITSYGNLYGVIYDIDTVTKRGRIDCETNEELFLAIAALRNDTHKNQWFTDGNKWILCPEIKFSIYWVYNDVDVNIDTVHKATVDELIEYFKIND
jgi:hypothetical protein